MLLCGADTDDGCFADPAFLGGLGDAVPVAVHLDDARALVDDGPTSRAGAVLPAQRLGGPSAGVSDPDIRLGLSGLLEALAGHAQQLRGLDDAEQAGTASDRIRHCAVLSVSPPASCPGAYCQMVGGHFLCLGRGRPRGEQVTRGLVGPRGRLGHDVLHAPRFSTRPAARVAAPATSSAAVLMSCGSPHCESMNKQ